MPEEVDFSSLENALRSLKEAFRHPPRNDLERDGAIQRFEYTFELCWKLIRRTLIAMGRPDVSASPKPLLRDAHQERFLSDIPAWFAFLEARNNATHIYDRKEAQKIFSLAKRFPPYVENLLAAIRNRVGS